MAVIVNPRGSAGSGKTTLVRRLITEHYGWDRSAPAEPIHGDGPGRPIAYLLRHPPGGRHLAVFGHYGAASRGGCDTVRASDGGLDAVFRLADELASAGHDVLLEGLRLSAEHLRSASLARRHALHILRLDTPPDRCARHLLARWRSRRDVLPLVTGVVAEQRRAVEEACARLGDVAASVEALGFDQALRRAQDLLGLARSTVPEGQAASGYPVAPDRALAAIMAEPAAPPPRSRT